MSVWRVETFWWRLTAVTGLVCGVFALFMAAAGIAGMYFDPWMPWSAVGLTAVGVGGILLLWMRMVKSGCNGLIWAAHWFVGWAYLLPIAKPLAALMFGILLLPVTASQVMVGYAAWRESGELQPESGRASGGVPVLILRTTASVVVLIIFLTGFRLSGLTWPSHRTCLWEVSHAASLRFPGSARMTNGYTDFGPLRTMLLAKVEMDLDDLGAFVRAFPPQWEKPTADAKALRFGNGPDPSYVYPRWFAKQPTQRSTVYRLDVSGWDATNVLVTADGTGRAFAYVYCYQD